MTMSSASSAPQILAGRRILVTGAARGLGLGFAQAFCAAGAQVALADIREDLLATAAEGLRSQGFAVHTVVADLSDPASI